MVEFIRKLNIRQRLNLGFGLLIALLVVLGLIMLGTEYLEVQSLNQLSRAERRLILIEQSKAEFLRLRQQEIDLRLAYQTDGMEPETVDSLVALNDSSLQTLRSQLAQVEELTTPGSHLAASDEISSLLSLLNEYEQLYDIQVEQLSQRGNVQNGLVGNMTTDLNALDAAGQDVSSIAVASAKTAMVDAGLRYINLPNVENSAQFVGAAQRLRTALQTVPAEEAAQVAEVQSSLTALETSYSTLLSLDVQLAQTRNQIQANENQFSELTAHIVEDIEADVNRLESDFNALAALVSALNIGFLLLALALGGFLAYTIARSISTPLSELSRAASQVSQGDFSSRAHILSKDEVGDLAQTFNQMTAQLQDSFNTLESRVAERTTDMQSVVSISNQISAILEMDRLLQDITDLIKDHFRLSHAQIYLIDDAQKQLLLVAGAGFVGRQMTEQGIVLSMDDQDSPVVRALQSRRPVVDRLQQQESPLHPLLGEAAARLSVPLIVHDKLLGALDLYSEQVEHFSQAEDAYVFSVLAGQTATAIDNARLFSRSQQRATELQTVAEVGADATTNLEMGQLLNTVVNLAKDRFQLYHAEIYLLDEQREQLVLAAGAGSLGRRMVKQGHKLSLQGAGSAAQAAREHRPIVVDEIAPSEQTNPSLPELRSEVALPLLISDEIAGVLLLLSNRPHFFQDADIHVQNTLAAQLSVAIQNARALEDARIARDEARILYEFSNRINRETDIQALIKLLRKTVAPTQTNSVLLLEYDSGDFNSARAATILAEWGAAAEFQIGETVSLTSLPFLPRMQRHQSSIVSDVTKDNRLSDEDKVALRNNGIMSFFHMPLILRSRWFASLIVFGPSAYQYSEMELRLLEGASEQLVTALDRLYLTEQMSRRARELQLVSEVSTEAAAALDTDQLLLDIVNLTKTSFGLYHVHVYLLDQRQEKLVLEAGSGEVGELMTSQGHTIALHNRSSIVARTARDRRSIIVNDVQQSAEYLGNPLLPDTHAEMAVPMVVGNLLLGVLDLQAEERDRFTQEDVVVMSTLASQIAVALQNARSFEQTQKRAFQLEIVNRVGREAATNLDIESLLPTVVDLTQKGFNLYHTHIYLLDDKQDVLILSAGAGDAGEFMKAQGHAINMRNENSLVARAARTRQSVVVGDVMESPEFLPNPFLPETRSEMSVPMLVGNTLIGVLDVQADSIDRFDEDDASIMATLASQVAVAVQNARAFASIEAAHRETERVLNSSIDMIGSANFEGYFVSLNPSWERVTGYSREELMAQPFLSFVHPDDVEMTNAEAAKIADGATAITFQNRYLTKNGDYRWISWNAVPDLQEGLMHFVARDITAEYLAEETLRKRALELQTVAEVSAQAASTLDVDQLLKDVANLTKERFNLYHAHIYLLDHRKQVLRLVAGAGDVGTLMVQEGREIALANTHSVVVQAVLRQEGVIINDVSLSDTFLPNPLLPDTRSEMAIPMIVAGAVIGVLDVQSDRINRFNEEDVRVKSTLAGQIAVAVQNARAFTSIEAAHRETERILNNSIDMIGSANFEGYFVSLNPSWERVTGYTIDELMAQPFLSFVHPDDVEMTNAEAAKLTEGVTSLSFENRYMTKDGGYRWVSWNVVPDPQEGLMHFVARDITAEHIAEENLRKSAVELQTVAEVSAQAASTLEVGRLLKDVVELTRERFDLYHAHVYLYDAENNELVLTAGAGEVGDLMVSTGYTIGYDREFSLVAQVARERRPIVVNNVMEYDWFLANPLLPDTRSELAVPLTAGDKLVGVLDIQSEEFDHFTQGDMQIMTTLAAQIAITVQNAQLYEEQVQAAEQLRELDRLKTEFLASMSHELRTPLNSIIGYAEVILDGLDGPLNDEMQEDVSAIHDSGKLLLALINDILDLAKIEAQQLDLDMEVIEVKPFLEDILDSAKILVKQKPVTMKLLLQDALPDVCGDRIRMQQVMNNLLSNAAKFTEEGLIEVCAEALPDLAQVRFSVRDSGVGIPPEKQEIIFERFRQADQSSTRRAGGTGLGLAITRQLIELHGGNIWVESEAGVGSTFYFTIPTMMQEEATSAESESQA